MRSVLLLLIMFVSCVTANFSGDLRLVRNGFSSSSYTSGRLEVYYNGRWRTVCDNNWSSTNTRVACHQLGFAGSNTSWTTSSAARLGSTSRPIWLDNVRCSGNESRLASCSRSSYGVHNCDHSKDVAIYCYTPKSITGSGVNFRIPDLGRILGFSISFGLVALSCLIGTPIALCRLCCSNSSLGDTTYTTTAQPVTPTTAVTVTMASSQKGGSQDYLATKTNVKEAPPAPHENFTERSPPSYEMSVYPPQMTSPTTPQEA